MSIKRIIAPVEGEVERWREKVCQQINNSPVFFVSDYGVFGDGVHDDSEAIQKAIDAASSYGGGTVQLENKEYLCNITLKSYVYIRGYTPTHIPSSQGGAANDHNKTTLKAKTSGSVVGTGSSAIYDAGIENISIIGLGASTAVKGIYLDNANRCSFRDITFDNLSDNAILIDEGVANHFSEIFAQNCLLDTTRSSKIGVMHIGSLATDNFISASEFTASLSGLTSANMYICAMVVEGATNFIRECVCEISDVGFYTTSGGGNRLQGVRADRNFGHGFEVSSTSGGNQFLGCTALRNSAETTNTYSGFAVSGVNNIFNGCMATSLAADGYYHKYGFYDSSSQGTYDFNIYSGCKSILDATAWFYSNSSTSPSPSIGTSQAYYITTGTTPSVENINFLSISHSGATTITNFTDGVSGQELTVKVANGNTTIANNATIKNNIESDMVLSSDKIYTFKNLNGVWYEMAHNQVEVDTTASSTGTDGTISSRSSSALGECNGFIKMHSADGTAVYVPYWENITP